LTIKSQQLFCWPGLKRWLESDKQSTGLMTSLQGHTSV
jgi:hypothetical protein